MTRIDRVPDNYVRLRENAVGRTACVSVPCTTQSYQWPGISFEAAFRGSSVAVSLDDDANMLDLKVDGKTIATLVRPGAKSFEISGLADGPHHIRLEKRTESKDKAAQFMGFYIPPHESPLTIARKSRQIEFIGDSDMVGFGVLISKPECSAEEIFENTDARKAYPLVVASELDAEAQVIARSGIAILGKTDNGRQMPDLYSRVLFDRVEAYRDSNWHPQVIVVSIGANDFTGPIQPGGRWADASAHRAAFETAYSAFLTRLRREHPAAMILLGAYETYNDDYFAATRAVLAARKAAGDRRIGLVTFPQLELTSCWSHESEADHRKMADIIIAGLQKQGVEW